MGEIVSVAYARAKGIPFIFSDESKLQELLDNEVNSGTDDDLIGEKNQSSSVT